MNDYDNSYASAEDRVFLAIFHKILKPLSII